MATYKEQIKGFAKKYEDFLVEQIDNSSATFNFSFKINNLREYIKSNTNDERFVWFVLNDYNELIEDLENNINFEWNFILLEKYKEQIDWTKVPNYEYLLWDYKLICKFKDYIIFKNITKKDYYREFRTKAIPHSFCITKRYELFYELNTGGYSNGYYFYYPSENISLSSSKHIEWIDEIFDCVLNKWDWSELSRNAAIYWSFDRIIKYNDLIDFNELSKNENVEWSNILLNRFSDKWNWSELSGNKGIHWDNNLLDEFENKLTWIPNNIDDLDFIGDILMGYKYPSISTNEGIYWDKRKLEKWHQKINIWIASRYGKLSLHFLNENYQLLCQTRDSIFCCYKYSDWRFSDRLKISGWELVRLNENFEITDENKEFLLSYNIEITYPQGNMANDGEYVTTEYKLIELFKSP